MSPEKTAIVLIGFQNDYFSPEGQLHSVIEDSLKQDQVLENTLRLISSLKDTDIHIFSTPIVFSENYVELVEPVGILKTIKDIGAFKRGDKGSTVISEIEAYGDRIEIVAGKKGLNAFSKTGLGKILESRGIENIILAGVVTSICIDSTARDAFERGYIVYILSDCTSGRSKAEQILYCENIFPLYSKVITYKEAIDLIEER